MKLRIDEINIRFVKSFIFNNIENNGVEIGKHWFNHINIFIR